MVCIEMWSMGLSQLGLHDRSAAKTLEVGGLAYQKESEW